MAARILIMDDDETVAKMLTSMLQLIGLSSDIAADGHAALEKYRQAKEAGTPFDAVIMDLTIPEGMGGQEAAGEVLNYDPNAVLIVASGNPNDRVITNHDEYGFKGAITKPFTTANIREVLEKAISSQ